MGRLILEEGSPKSEVKIIYTERIYSSAVETKTIRGGLTRTSRNQTGKSLSAELRRNHRVSPNKISFGESWRLRRFSAENLFAFLAKIPLAMAKMAIERLEDIQGWQAARKLTNIKQNGGNDKLSPPFQERRGGWKTV